MTLDPQAGSTEIDILIVDDTIENIRFLSLMLQDQGYAVRKALNGPMALTAAQTVVPDLILLDINMPEINGYDVCQKLKENPRTAAVPVIFLSALDDVTDKVKAFQSGGVDFITKPFQVEEVLVRIQTQLKIKLLQTQLQERNTQLQTALDDLQQTQAQLIRKEKMSSLGQVVAGVSHEINNPISFISGNLSPARVYIEDLLTLIETYQTEYPEPTPAIEALLDNLDLNFLKTDLHKLLDSMQSGVERIRSIMLALRIFSRLGESDIKTVDIHEGLESTLLFLRHRLVQRRDTPPIEILKSYGELPLITCYAGEINQVFFNLLNNAIDALELKDRDDWPLNENPTIWLETEYSQNESIMIRVRDNGIGVPPDMRSRLFDPFFTTKPVGQGMGLGLAISYQIIVEKHHGSLTYHSCPGSGTEFVLELPLLPADQIRHSPSLLTGNSAL